MTVWAMVVLAEIYKQDGNLAHAERWFREAIKAQYGYMPAHRGLGDTLRLQGHYNEAYASLELAVALAPEDVPARRMLGYALLGASRLDDALTTFQGALEISHGHPDVTADIVTVLTRLDNYEEALRRARAAVSEHPRSLAARLALGSVLCDVGEFDEAIPFLRSAAEDAPGNANVSYWLGWALDNLGQQKHLGEARAALERAVSIDDVPAYRIELANILRALGDPAASGMYAEVLDAFNPNSTDPQELAFIGWCHYGRNEFEEAVRLYRLSLRIAPKGVEVQFDLALARLCQKRAELAADEYQYGLDLLQRQSRLRRRGLLQVALVDLQQARRLLKLDRGAKASENVLRAALRSHDGAASGALS
jgi:tetratricopeptide (TPR) repeat protein